jgi:predicted ATP-grasp superfamily ATP-dependent carboligase
MRILVFEYITGGGMRAETLPASLVREGDLMLGALLRDLSEIPEIRLAAFRDARLRLPESAPESVEWIRLDSRSDLETCFREQVDYCDAVWPIAPETGGILERLCHPVSEAGKALLTSPAGAVRIAASKLNTVRRLEAHGVPVVPTVPLASSREPHFPAVVKPDDGVGGEGARIIETPTDWREFADNPHFQDYVAQPLMEGDALSLSALFAQGEVRLLSCNRQHIARENGGFILKGCGVNIVNNNELDTFRDLAERIASALPELWGYAGVDLIRSERGLHVLEINPRLTTSYAGLRASLGLNPAELVLNLWRHGRLPEFAAERREPVEISLEPRHAH